MKTMKRVLLTCMAVVVTAGCGQEPLPTDPEAIREAGELVVLTRNAPTTYYVDRHDKPSGFEHDLAVAFAEHLDVDVRFEVRHSIGEIKEGLRQGEGHLAAAGLTRIDRREEDFLFGPAYHQVQQQLVCRRGGTQPRSMGQLADISLKVIADSSYEARLEELREEIPDLEWESDDSLSTEMLMQMVWEREVDCTVADSNIVAINRRYFPELTMVMPLSETQDLAWMMPGDATELRKVVNEWFAEVEEGALLSNLMTRYYSHVEIFDYVDISRYLRRIDELLPRYRDLFEEAAEEYEIEWTLLAAQAYQESHWNPEARSPTGVRGIMMLTRRTAEELGVDDRLDPEQSIMGGARYLANLRERLPEDIEEPDRTWIALAAYNVGMSHIYDARRLARRYGLDPDRWSALRKMLPKLSQPAYYRDLPFGYARGSEPVQYLRRIRNYQELLERHLDGREIERTRFW